MLGQLSPKEQKQLNELALRPMNVKAAELMREAKVSLDPTIPALVDLLSLAVSDNQLNLRQTDRWQAQDLLGQILLGSPMTAYQMLVNEAENGEPARLPEIMGAQTLAEAENGVVKLALEAIS